jgi:hypothetical protein
MHQTTQLASGLINGHDRLTVELVEPPDLPPRSCLGGRRNHQSPHQTPTPTWQPRRCRCWRRRSSSWVR